MKRPAAAAQAATLKAMKRPSAATPPGAGIAAPASVATLPAPRDRTRGPVTKQHRTAMNGEHASAMLRSEEEAAAAKADTAMVAAAEKHRAAVVAVAEEDTEGEEEAVVAKAYTGDEDDDAGGDGETDEKKKKNTKKTDAYTKATKKQMREERTTALVQASLGKDIRSSSHGSRNMVDPHRKEWEQRTALVIPTAKVEALLKLGAEFSTGVPPRIAFDAEATHYFHMALEEYLKRLASDAVREMIRGRNTKRCLRSHLIGAYAYRVDGDRGDAEAAVEQRLRINKAGLTGMQGSDVVLKNLTGHALTHLIWQATPNMHFQVSENVISTTQEIACASAIALAARAFAIVDARRARSRRAVKCRAGAMIVGVSDARSLLEERPPDGLGLRVWGNAVNLPRAKRVPRAASSVGPGRKTHESHEPVCIALPAPSVDHESVFWNRGSDLIDETPPAPGQLSVKTCGRTRPTVYGTTTPTWHLSS
jgi:histone H3/H4